jgi:transcriptional regulator GlxA family with amidase domain
MIKVAILTFEGFNEIDSFVACGILNRMKKSGWKAEITCPASTVTSMNGVAVTAQRPLEFAAEADAVLVGSGVHTRAIAADAAMMGRITLDPRRQLIGSQCSGALVLAKLGLLEGVPACTDSTTKPWVVEAGVRVVDESFVASGNVATAGGCMSSQYLAAWVIARLAGFDAAAGALRYVAPVGEKDAYVTRVLDVVRPFVAATAPA